MANTPPKAPILYAKTEIGGILVRPDSGVVMRKAIEGHPIEVTSGNGYINLYHVFERMQMKDKSLAKLAMVRRQVGPSHWLVFLVPEGQDAPEVELLEDYDPKRGRYKRYAEQLAEGEALEFSVRAEAVKARRAWQLYVPRKSRQHLRPRTQRVGKSNRWVVQVVPKQQAID